MHRCICVPAILIILTLPLQARASDRASGTANIRSVISGVITAYGGEKALNALSSLYEEGHIDAFAFGDQGTYRLYFKRPKKLLVDIHYSRSQEIRILNGDRGYYGTGRVQPYEVHGFRYLAILYEYKSQDIPYSLFKGAYKVTYEGRDEVEGVQTVVLGLTGREGPPMKVYVDTTTFLIRKISGLFHIGGTATALASEFSDFRKTGGTVLPYRFINYAGGEKIAETVIREYRINAQMDNSLFNPATCGRR